MVMDDGNRWCRKEVTRERVTPEETPAPTDGLKGTESRRVSTPTAKVGENKDKMKSNHTGNRRVSTPTVKVGNKKATANERRGQSHIPHQPHQAPTHTSNKDNDHDNDDNTTPSHPHPHPDTNMLSQLASAVSDTGFAQGAALKRLLSEKAED